MTTATAIHKDPPCLTAALEYARLGFPVLPCHSVQFSQSGQPHCTCPKGAGCISNSGKVQIGKHPRTKNGVKDATTDETQIRGWWSEWPDANVAILTGERSGLMVLDVDPRNGGMDSLNALPDILETPWASTGTYDGCDGKHIFFRRKHGLHGGSIGPGLDIKGADGDGYVIAEPSTHYTRTNYRFGMRLSNEALIDVPQWLVERLTPPPPKPRLPAPSRYVGTDERMKRAEAYLEKCDPAVEGQRGSADMFAVASRVLRGFDITPEEGWDMFRRYNASCIPPWDEETDRGPDSLMRKLREGYEKGNHAMGGLLDRPMPDHLNGAEIICDPDPARTFTSIVQMAGPRADNDDRSDPPAETEGPPAFVPFPTELLPEPLCTFVRQGAKATQSDESTVAMHMLAMLASCIGTTRRIQLSKQWKEWCALWTLSVSESGQRKSPPLDLAVNEPMAPFVSAAAREFEGELKAYKQERAAWEASKKKDDDGDAVLPPEMPYERRYIISDVTVEAMVVRLQFNPRGLLLSRDELSGWLESFGQYKGGAGGDAAHFAQWYNATPDDVDRKGGPLEERHIHLDHPLISVTGTIQPDNMRDLMTPALMTLGLAARFLLTRPPPIRKRHDKTLGVDDSVKKDMATLVEWLLGLNFEPGPDYQPIDIPLDDEADALWGKHVDDVADRTEATESASMKAALSKLEGAAARIALVIHLARWACGGAAEMEPGVVDAESVRRGVALAQWCMAETERIYRELGWYGGGEKAGKILQLLRATTRGMTESELEDLTGKRGGVHAACLSLGDLVRCVAEPGRGTKPIRRWFAVQRGKPQ